jgi:hypothetical protein
MMTAMIHQLVALRIGLGYLSDFMPKSVEKRQNYPFFSRF